MFDRLRLLWYRIRYGEFNWEAVQVIAENQNLPLLDLLRLSKQDFDKIVATITPQEIARRIAYKRHQNS